MRRGGWRRLGLAACGVACLLGLGLTAAYFTLASTASEPTGSVEVPGLERPVRVLSDTFDIPHVWAAGDLDAARALGYLHAFHRLWQMDLFRRIAAGRLSELFGERALATDRFIRTLDLWGSAGRAVQALDPDERLRLRAYAEGVNARIAERGSRPLELTLLGAQPEAWDETSSLAVGMVMSLDLSHWRNDLSRFWASRNLPPRKQEYLELGYPDWGPTILDGPDAGTGLTTADAAGSRLTRTPGAPRVGSPPTARLDPGRPSAGSSVRESDDPFEVLAVFSARSASNAWVVAGSRTASGHPILANDMHLGLRAPALWYLAGLHADSADLHVAGLTLPGVPGVIVGYNRDVAWGFTNGMVDDMDFVVEETDSAGKGYRNGEEWLAFTARAETIQVRGRQRPEVWTVRETVRGPIISDVLPGLGATLSAVWVAARTPASGTGIWEMNRAKGIEEFDRAIRGFAQPHQNVVFASRGGHIGYRLGGRIPLREGYDGALPVPQETFGEAWPGFWPSAQHPAGRDPGWGYFATANNLQARALGRSVSTDYAEPFRAQRIGEVLAGRDDWTVPSTVALQLDTRSLLADRALPQAIRAARGIGEVAAAARLESWNRRVEVGSEAAPLFYSWLYRLRALIAGDEYHAAPEWEFFPLDALLRVLEEADASPWVDDVRTPEVETLAGLAERAMRDALRVTAGRTWGEVHQERHVHPLGHNRWLQSLFGLHVGPYPAPGGPHTVRPDDYRRWASLDSASWAPPWLSEYGPSERFVAHLRPNGPEGFFLIPTGQSGHPFSDHYRDQAARWEGESLVPVPLEREAAEARAVRRFVLTPVRRPRAAAGTSDPRRAPAGG